MSGKSEKLYVGVYKTKSSPVKYAIRTTIDEIRDRIGDSKNKSPIVKGASGEVNDFEKVGESHTDVIIRLMRACIRSSGEQLSAVRAVSAMTHAFYDLMLKEAATKLAPKLGTVVEEDKKLKIYEIPHENKGEFFDSLSVNFSMLNGTSPLPKSIFLGIIAGYESMFLDIVSSMIKMSRMRFLNSDIKVEIKEISKFSSINDFIDGEINKYVSNLLRGSHSKQIEAVEEHFNISIRDKWVRYPEFIEMFQRRNLIAHGVKSFNQQYFSELSKVKFNDSSVKVGDPIELPSNYLLNCAELILECQFLMMSQYWRKHIKKQSKSKDDTIFNFMADQVFDLIKSRRYQSAVSLSNISMLNRDIIPESTLRMVAINLASAYLHMDDNKKCKEVLDSFDWTASHEKYRICVWALLGEFDKFKSLAFSYVKTNDNFKSNLDDWPVFDIIKKHDDFPELYMDLFGKSSDVKGGPSERSKSIGGVKLNSEIEMGDKSPSVH